MSLNIRNEILANSIVDITRLNIQELAIAAYLNVMYYYYTEKHWRWLKAFSNEIVNLPKHLYLPRKTLLAPVACYEQNLANRFSRNGLVLGFIPESCEDTANLTTLSADYIAMQIYYDEVAETVRDNPLYSNDLRETVERLTFDRDFQQMVDGSTYLLKVIG